MMREKVQVEIPYGVVEYTAVFLHPIFEAWETEALAAQAFGALEPYGFTIEGVEYKDESEKASEQAIVFRRTNPPTPPTSVTVGLSKVVVMAENLDWSEADRFISMVRDGMGSVVGIAGAELKSQHVSLGMHVQIKEKQSKDVLMPLLSPEGLRMLEGNVTLPGIILHVDKGHIIIDGSAAFANALFIRITREHAAATALEDLAATLRRDEERVFEVLGFEGTL